MYFERQILKIVRGSKEQRDLERLCGYQDLIKTVHELKDEPEFTKLVPSLIGVDPDDAFSRIPYEKGCLFLIYLEHLVCVVFFFSFVFFHNSFDSLSLLDWRRGTFKLAATIPG
jgi:leukotriene-A4 hydrolase